MKDFNMDDYNALKGSTLVKGLEGSEQLRFDSVESATVFFARELDQVKTKTYDKQYPELSALSCFPITSEVNEGAETTTYYSYDITGMAAIINNYATDLPRVDVQGESHTASIKSVGDSYGYNVQEMRASRMAGKSLDARKGAAARRASDYMVNKIAFAGDKKHNLVGIFSDGTDIPLYTLSEVEVDGKKYTDWAHKTADQILEDIRERSSCMAAYKDEARGTWYVSFHYNDWTGKNKRKLKRGFRTRKEALEYEQKFLLQQATNLDMRFEDFYKLYEEDLKPKLKLNTWRTKDVIFQKKLIPYFKDKKMNEISPADIIKWQNEMIKKRQADGKPYKPTYLKTMQSELSAIFNHAVRFYNLRENPVKKAGTIGKGKADEMDFWTKEEYLKFIECVKDKPISYYAFQILYWCGIREGELLALTPADIDFENKKLHITKSYQYINGEDIITDPKTEKSRRDVVIPDFLVEELRQFIGMLYGYGRDDRIFQITKSYLHHEMSRGAKAAGVKRIRIHDLRHSHISLLIRLGFSAVAIGNRVGHESQTITFHYAHMFPTEQIEMADKLNEEFVPGTGNGGDVQ